MASDISIKLAVEGEKTFNTAIKSANAQIKAMDAELKATISGMDAMNSAEEKVKARTQALGQQLDANKQKLSVLSKHYDTAKERLSNLAEELEAAKNKGGDNTAEVTKASNAYNQQAQKVANLQRQMAETNTVINEETKELDGLNNKLAQTGQKLQEVGGHISSAGQKINSVGSKLTTGVTAPLLAAGTASAKFASDYEENLNKVDASFKDNAQEVRSWAKTATQQFGMSESAALEATSLFGDMGTSMGLTTKEAASMSTELAGLAGDLASFKNINIDEAMTALKGVFTGETESLKTLGVVMTETNLKAFASDMGLVYDSMSQAEKVTLRYQYVLANTTNAQGDYARTSDGTANSIRTMQAEASNLAAAFGQELLPQITPLIQDATELIRKFGELDEGTKKNIISAALFAAGVGPVVTGVGKVTEGVGKAAEGIGKLTKYIAGGGGLNIALGAGAAAVVGLGAALANAAIDAWSMDDATKALYKSMEETAAAGEAQRTEIEGNAAAALALVGDLEALADKENKSNGEKQQMKAMVETLNSLVPDLGASYDDLSDSLNISTDAMKDFIKQSARTQVAASYQEELTKAYKDQADNYMNLAEKKTAVESATKDYNTVLAQQNDLLEAGTIDQSMYDAAMHTALVTKEAAIQDEKDAQAAYDASTEAVTAAETAVDGYSDALEGSAGAQKEDTDATKANTEAKQEQAQAAAETKAAIMDIAYAAVDARVSGDDLRASYDELSGKLEKLKEDGDETAVMLAEQKLYLLDIVATNQELAESFGTLGIDAGDSLTGLSGFLIDAEVSAEEFASGVASMRESVVNDFQRISTENELTADKLVKNLEANLKTQQAWSSNLSGLWDQAYADQDQSVMAFINYLAQKGPEYASVVAEFANGGYAKLQEAAAAWSGIGQQSASDYASGIYMDQYLAGEAATGMSQEVMDALNGANLQGAGSEIPAEFASNLSSGSGAVSTAAQEMAMAAHTSIAQIGWSDLGGAIDQGIATGISGGSSTIGSAGKAAAMAAHTEIAQIGWVDLGTAMGQGISNGLSNSTGTVEGSASAVAEAAKSSAGNVDFTYIGRNMSAGIASGIRAGRSGVVSAAVSVVKAAVTAAKNEADIHSPSRVMRDEVGEQLTKGVAVGMVSNEALNDLRAAANVLTGIVTDSLSGLNASIAGIEAAQERRAAEKELRDFEESMADLQQKYAEAALEDREEIQKQIDEKQADWDEKRLKEQEEAQIESLKSQISYLEDFQDAYDEALKDYQDSYQDAYNDIMSKQANMAEKMASFGDLYSYNEGGYSLRLEDLEKQTLAIEEYGEMLEQLQERGIRDDLMEEVLGMDIKDAWNYGSRLLGLSDASYEQYMDSWAKKQELAQDIAERFYKDDLDALNSEYVEKIPEIMDGLKDQMGDLGTDAAQALAAAFEAQQDTIADAFLSTINAAYERAAESISAPIASDYVTREDLYKATSGAVNGLNMAMAASQPQQAGEINMYINDTKIATAMLPSLRAVSKANPEVVSDR